MVMSANQHCWRFFRAGGFDQVHIGSGSDVLALDTLDQKLWVALACPTSGLEFDQRTLELLDSDRDGRIRAQEIIDTVIWLRRVLKDPELLVQKGDVLPLASIDDRTREGARLLASARRILINIGKGAAQSIEVADVLDTQKIFAQTRFNGDGVIPAAAAADDETSAFILEIIACFGPTPDRSGADGIDQAKANAFFDGVERVAAWLDQSGAIQVLATDTADAVRALEAVRDKINDFFMLCRLAAYSEAAARSVNADEATYAPLARMGLRQSLEVLTSLPLAAVAPNSALPLNKGLNPGWAPQMEKFCDLIVHPMLGPCEILTEDDWKAIADRFSGVVAFQAAKPDTPVNALAPKRIQEIAKSDAREKINALIAEDVALTEDANGIDDVTRLLLLKRDLYRFLNNFVSFSEFYARTGNAIFQAGALYLDGRRADLCVRVDDPARHAALATLSRIYLVYCQCQRRGSNEHINIAAAFTSGESDQLMVGRNGVFYDRSGRDWDATVVKIVEHPISVRQAFWSPYQQLARFVSEQIEKIAAARAKVVQTDLQKAAAQTFDVAKFAGIFAALGLAVGAIGTAFAAVITGFLNLLWWQMPLALAGMVLAISGPSILIATMKLRQRNLAPILDANGWAVNTRARINIPFGASLTALARLPQGAKRSLRDPYAEKHWPTVWWGVAGVVTILMAGLAWYFVAPSGRL